MAKHPAPADSLHRTRAPSRLRSVLAMTAATAVLAASGGAAAQTCPFDDGNSALTREGLVLTRYALGMRGAPLLAGTDLAGQDPGSIDITVNCPACGLDINGNGTFDTTDATIISRKLAGITGPALTDSLSLGNGTRNTFAAINSFLLAACGTSNGTVTSIATGTGLTGGPITGTGTISIADSGVGSAQIASGAVTSSKLGAASVTTTRIADNAVSQSKLFALGTETAGNLLSTTGPTGSLAWVAPPALSCTSANSAVVENDGNGTTACAVATCPAGYTVTAGGLISTTWPSNAALRDSAVYYNATSGNGWSACYLHVGTGTITFSTRARCCRVN
jgi:hypothetical protein